MTLTHYIVATADILQGRLSYKTKMGKGRGEVFLVGTLIAVPRGANK